MFLGEPIANGTARMKLWLAIGAAALLCLIGAQFVTIFVVQPIGALPEGRTLVITRLNTMNFIDSADAWCDRQQGGVSLFCRAAVLGRVGNQSTILLRMPYSEFLYKISTNGRTFDR
jgi:hypothetical protein